MNEKQKKLLEWIKKLELFAQNENLPIRLIDSIFDLKEQVVKENTDCYKLYENVESLLQSIKQKLQKETSQEIVVNDEIIGVDEVRKIITETIKRGHSENIASISNVLYGNITPTQECYRQMKEITTNKDALNKIADGNYFLHFFQVVKQNYERNISRNINDFVEGVSNNCMRMGEKIRSICRNIDGYKLGLGEEEFYVNYNERKEGWDNQLRYDIETAGLGGHVIIDFAKATLEKIQPIIKSFKKKRNFYIVLPCLILFICIALVGGFLSVNKYTEFHNNQINIENAQINNDSEDETQSSTSERVNAVQNLSSNVEQEGSGIIEMMKDVIEGVKDIKDIKDIIEGTKDIITYIIVIVIVILLLYAKYIKYIIKLYHNKITSACGECLQKECALFEKEDRMNFCDEIKEILTEYEHHYLEGLNEIFKGTILDCCTIKKNSEYDQLCKEWNNIQRMQEGV